MVTNAGRAREPNAQSIKIFIANGRINERGVPNNFNPKSPVI